jgi:hypothetical protein
MCIACELGFLSMVDALEAERSAMEKRARDESAFACEPTSESDNLPERRRVQRSADEPAP